MRLAGLIGMVTLIWGYNLIVTKIGLDLIPPFLFVALRLMGGAGVLLLVLILMKREWIPKKGDWPALIIMGILMSAGFFGLLSYGM